MPTISEFYGIIIRMFFTDHNPPHFHAVYGEFEIVVQIAPIRILDGHVPIECGLWTGMAVLHQEELLEDWNRCQKGGD